MKSTRAVLLLLSVFSPTLATPAAAEQVADFYKGKTITIVVGTAAGGGYDDYARSAARHLPRFVPGSPTIIVQNRPGAASLNAANYVYNGGAQDGTMMVATSRAAPLLQIMGEKGPNFETAKFQWLGSLNSDAGAMYVWHTTKVKAFADLKTVPVYFGSSGPNDSEFYPALANNVLGTKILLIRGYESGPMVRLATESGEVQGQSQTWDSVKSASPDWIAENKIRVLAQIALKPREDMTRLGAPMILDLVTRENVLPQYTVEEAQSYFRLMLTGNQLGRPFAFGPGVPAERVAALRKAIAAMAADPQFIADAAKEKRNVELMSGEEMQTMYGDLAVTPKTVLENARKLIRYQGEIKSAPGGKQDGGKKR